MNQIQPLQWTPNSQPNKEIPYNHSIANTPFGRFLLTWKEWKDPDQMGIGFEETPWGRPWYQGWNEIEEAKENASEEYQKRILQNITHHQPPNVSDKIEGIPEGWRLVKVTNHPKIGEHALSYADRVVRVSDPDEWDIACIVERIKPPKPKYRPFANAAEFEPHRDRWIKSIKGGETEGANKITGYDNRGVWVGSCDDVFPYEEALELLAFEKLEPFGIEVKE